MTDYGCLLELSEVDMKVLEKALKMLPLIDERVKIRRGSLRWSDILEDDLYIKQLEFLKKSGVHLLNECSDVEKEIIYLKFWQFQEELTWKRAIKMIGETYSAKEYRKSILTRLARNLGWI